MSQNIMHESTSAVPYPRGSKTPTTLLKKPKNLHKQRNSLNPCKCYTWMRKITWSGCLGCS